jgi:redox-sensitive bicupin YhaK (pirin superfamily)
LDVQEGHNALVYVLSGAVAVSAGEEEQWLVAEHAVGMRGDAASAMLKAGEDAHLLVLTGAEIREPVVGSGPFIMNDQAQIDDAITRYRAGRMGQLAAGD